MPAWNASFDESFDDDDDDAFADFNTVTTAKDGDATPVTETITPTLAEPVNPSPLESTHSPAPVLPLASDQSLVSGRTHVWTGRDVG